MAPAGTKDAAVAERARTGLTRALLSNHLAQLIERLEIDCVLDVGAHKGEHGMVLRGLGYQGPIVSFEPVQSSFAELEREMAAHPPWSGHRIALGAESGEAEITVYPATEFSSLAEPSRSGRELFPGLNEGTRETVAVRTLDEVLPEAIGEEGRRPMLKIDAQGYEWQVLSGASQSLDQVIAVQVETSVNPLYKGVHSFEEVIARLRGHGFELSGLFPISHDPQFRLLELDCLMIRPSA